MLIHTYKAKLFHFCLPVLSLCMGCTPSLELVREKEEDAERRSVVQSIRSARSQTIVESQTFYTPGLRCIGDTVAATLPPGGEITVSVAPILDKTGKVYPQHNSTAISDLVSHSLSKIRGFRLIDTPLGYDVSESRANFQHLRDARTGSLPLQAFGAPIGVTLPSQIYITGALLQYDERTETPNSTLSVDVAIFRGRKSVNSISVALQLRMINAANGRIIQLPSTGENLSVYMTNKLYKIDQNANVFKMAGSNPYGVDYDVSVSDPAHYAIYEIVEKSLFELFSKYAGLQNERGGANGC